MWLLCFFLVDMVCREFGLQIRILENEAKNGSTPAQKRKMMEQVRHCRTKWTSLKTSLEKEMLVGDARAGKSPDSSKDANTVRFSQVFAGQQEYSMTDSTFVLTQRDQMERCAERVDRLVALLCCMQGHKIVLTDFVSY